MNVVLYKNMSQLLKINISHKIDEKKLNISYTYDIH